MSWAEDEGIDAYWGDEYSPPQLGLEVDDKFRHYWTTKAGDEIYIEDMEVSHIKNILRNADNGKFALEQNSYDRFVTELSIRRRLFDATISVPN